MSRIFDLPEQIADYILNLLPLCDRKSLSLVSRACSRESFSFHTMADIKLSINSSEIEEERDLSVLRESIRPYRHLAWYFGHGACSELDLENVMNILSRCGSSVESFTLLNNCNQNQLRELLLRMPNLERITVNVIDKKDQVIDSKPFPIMEHLIEFQTNTFMIEEPWVDIYRIAPNVRKLGLNLMSSSTKTVETIKVIQQYGSQLEYLELFASNNRVPIEKLNLSQLHTLKLWGLICDQDANAFCHFFRNLPLLHIAFLCFNVTSNMLHVISKNCPLLTNLRFKTDALSQRSFRYFIQLKNLRELTVDGYIDNNQLQYCLPLKTVDFFSMSRNPRKPGPSMERISRLFPKMRTLHMNRAYEMNCTLVREICRHFRQLKCLIIDTIHMSSAERCGSERVLSRIFTQLVEMKNLEELTLTCLRLATTNQQDDCQFTNFLRACAEQDENQRFQSKLRQLKINGCPWLMGDTLVNTVQLFPGLRNLEVSQCRLITREDMDSARKVLPECKVDFIRWEKQYNAAEWIESKLYLSYKVDGG